MDPKVVPRESKQSGQGMSGGAILRREAASIGEVRRIGASRHLPQPSRERRARAPQRI